MKIRIISAFAIAFLFSIMGITFTGNPLSIYFDPFSFIMVILLPHIIQLFIIPPSRQKRLFTALMNDDSEGGEDLIGAVIWLKSLKRMVIYSTFFSFFLGLIGILVNLLDPDSMSCNFAVALISVFYGVFYIMAVIEPLRLRGEMKLSEG